MLISSQVRQKRRYLVSENDIISTLISILKTHPLSSPFSPYSMTKFPTALKPAARSAYREVLRAARITFQGSSPLALFFLLDPCLSFFRRLHSTPCPAYSPSCHLLFSHPYPSTIRFFPTCHTHFGGKYRCRRRCQAHHRVEGTG